MSLIDKTLITKKNSHTIKPWWEICIYCYQPFTTATFEKTCERCRFFEKYKKEYQAKLMIRYILAVTISAITTSIFALFLSKYVKNTYQILLFLSILNLIIGTIFYRSVKR
jgi:hypothetical protein